MKKLFFLLCLAGCAPMSQPNLGMPETFTEGGFIEPCGGECVDLVSWWEQFNDPLLNVLITRSISCNHDLLLARERICEARAALGMEAAKLFPYIDQVSSVERTRNSETISGASLQGGTFVDFFTMGFDSIWEIDIFGKIFDRAKAAAYDIIAQMELVRDVHLSITSEVAKQYFVIRNLQSRIEITRQHIKTETALVAIVQDRFDVGLIPELDLYTAKAVLEARLADLPSLEARLNTTIYSLAVLLGAIPEVLVHEFDTLIPQSCTNGKIPLGLPSELLCRRGDVRQAEYAMYAAGARLMAARKELFPTLSLESFFQFNSGFYSRWFNMASQEWMVNPSLLLPVFHGGHIRSFIRAETSKQRQAVIVYEQSVLEALEEVESTLNNYFQQSARLNALTAEASNYKEARELAEILYIGGIVDFLYLIQSERDLYFSEIALSESYEFLMTDLVAIYKALGGGWEC